MVKLGMFSKLWRRGGLLMGLTGDRRQKLEPRCSFPLFSKLATARRGRGRVGRRGTRVGVGGVAVLIVVVGCGGE